MVPAEGEPVLSVDASPDGSVGRASSPRIELVGVTRRYDVGDTEVTAIEDVSLEVDESAFVVILGPSGCGKTTLLNLIGALDTPTTGSVRVAGDRPHRRLPASNEPRSGATRSASSSRPSTCSRA